jgi:hypothetical protein
MSDTCEMRELTDAELDGVCGACRHHGWEHHGLGHFGKLWGAGNQLGGLISHSFNTVTQTVINIAIIIGGSGNITQIGANSSNV